MPAQFTCPQCGKVITVAFVQADSQVICPECHIQVNPAQGDGDRPWGPPAEPVAGEAAASPGLGGPAVVGGAARAPAKSSGAAVASMILGIVSLPLSCCGFGILTAIAGLIVGVIALRKIKRSRGAIRGRGMAQAGIIMSGMVIVIVIVLTITAVIRSPDFFRNMPESFRQMRNSSSQIQAMQQIGAACQSYATSNRGKFPDRLERLVDQGYVTSVADPETGDPYVYIGKGQSVNAMADTIIAFSETPGFMGTHGVIMSNGQATMLPKNILAGMLQKQGVPEDLIP